MPLSFVMGELEMLKELFKNLIAGLALITASTFFAALIIYAITHDSPLAGILVVILLSVGIGWSIRQ